MNPYFYSLTSLLAGEDEAKPAPSHGKFTLDGIEYLKRPVPIGHGCGGCVAEHNLKLCLSMPECGVGGDEFIFLKWSES